MLPGIFKSTGKIIMKRKELRAKAKQLGIKIDSGADTVELVRTIQIAEGFDDCFGRGLSETCGQTDCCFKNNCQ